MKKIIKICLLVLLVFVLSFIIINLYVVNSTKKQILNNEYGKLKNIDCILVLGAGVWGDEPSPMLEDRLNTAIKLYKLGVAKKIIMSGDHGRENYDEVNIMKRYAVENGVSSSDIFMDHAGFSTYDSIYRAKEIFLVKNMVIVTQKYHMFRSLHIANKLGINSYGINADKREYVGQMYRETREILARNKDFIKSIIKPKPKYLGKIIPVSGNGNITNDKI